MLEDITQHFQWVKLTKGIPDILAIGAGAYKGYCDAQGISIVPEINTSMKYGPTLIQAGLGGYLGLIEGIATHGDRPSCIVKRTLLGAAIGAIETGLGYCLGHTIGSLAK
jgi:hypothetical protein